MRTVGVTARRVDRIEHNDDIDNRIIAEITEADFVLADLTYARPSVYWEAGYAQRSIPVIYTVRKDHLDRQTEDPCGHLQVHFDLRMRNIITWSTARDPTFLKRLRARTVKVIAPIQRKKTEDGSRNQQITTFDRLSFHAQRQQLVDIGADHFRQIGYSIIDLSRSDEETRKLVSWYHGRALPGALIANRFEDGVFHSILFHVVPAVSSEFIKFWQMSGLLCGLIPEAHDHKVKEAKQDIVVCSLGRSGLDRLRKGIPSAYIGNDDRSLIRELDYESKTFSYPRRQTFYVLESTPTLLNLKAELNARFKRR